MTQDCKHQNINGSIDNKKSQSKCADCGVEVKPTITLYQSDLIKRLEAKMREWDRTSEENEYSMTEVDSYNAGIQDAIDEVRKETR